MPNFHHESWGGFPISAMKADNDLVPSKMIWACTRSMHALYNPEAISILILFMVPVTLQTSGDIQRRHRRYSSVPLIQNLPHLSDVEDEEQKHRHETHSSSFGGLCIQHSVLQRKRRAVGGRCGKFKWQIRGVHWKAEWTLARGASLNVCGMTGRAVAPGLLPHTEDPPVASLGCRSHTWAPHSRTRPTSDEPPAKEGTPSSSSGRGTPTHGSWSCAAAAGKSLTRGRNRKHTHMHGDRHFSPLLSSMLRLMTV